MQQFEDFMKKRNQQGRLKAVGGPSVVHMAYCDSLHSSTMCVEGDHRLYQQENLKRYSYPVA